jgi:hypothetical protein
MITNRTFRRGSERAIAKTRCVHHCPAGWLGFGVQQSLTDPQEGERSLVLPVDFPIDRSSTEPPRIRPLKAVEGHEHE